MELLTYAELREKISITELALANGYQFNKHKSSKNNPVLDHPLSGDRIVVSNPSTPGNQLYFNVYDDFDKGTLVDFVRRRLPTIFQPFNKADKSEHSNINAVLRDYLNLPESYRKKYSEGTAVITREVSKEGNAFRSDLLDLQPLQGRAFLLNRGITNTTLNHPNFAGTIYNIENKNGYINTAFPYYDAQDNLIGCEVRNQAFKHHTENSKKSVGVWHSNVPETVDEMVLTESPIDALSYHQLHGAANMLYIATGGHIAPEQLQTILSLYEKIKAENEPVITLAFDRDKEGAKYDLLFLLAKAKNLLPEATIERTKDFLHFSIPADNVNANGWIVGLTDQLKSYNKPLENELKGKEDRELKQDIDKMLFHGGVENKLMKINIPNSFQPIHYFNTALIKSLGMENRVRIEKAVGKDFNEDLTNSINRKVDQKQSAKMKI